MTVAALTRWLAERLAPAAGEDARFEARLIAAEALDVRPNELPGLRDEAAAAAARERAEEMLRRRLLGEPLQYILGEWEFMGLPFLVGPEALIPRPDTEILCERALLLAKARGYRTALDLCCGTGCIGVSLARRGGLAVTCADLSAGCAALTRRNAEKNGVALAAICCGDLFAPLRGQRFDLICCNPPYLSDGDMAQLQRELTFEPALALHGGADGLAFYRRIAAEYAAHLNPGGALLLEIGSTQAEQAQALFRKTQLFYDYAGNPRVVLVEET